ncbi:MAG: bifunctional DNA-formamidopyrimidine glycosylase/DNA-(apurinic or apyrimidinic site) lyase [Chloroflexota bacterium]
MPELPEVETIARRLSPILVGRVITAVDLRWARSLATPAPSEFRQRLGGQTIESITRRGKYLRLYLSQDQLLIHLRMSGDLFTGEVNRIPEKHDRLILGLSGDLSLIFNDTRKFGRIWLTDDPNQVLGTLGPEPLDDEFTPQIFFDRLHNRHRQLKPLLLDQTFLAGMGNIYTDEALHLAGLHPRKLSDHLTEHQAANLWQAIRNILLEGIHRNGASIDWVYRGGDFQNFFRVYDREGETCPVCETRIEKMIVGQRGTHICPNCQSL